MLFFHHNINDRWMDGEKTQSKLQTSELKDKWIKRGVCQYIIIYFCPCKQETLA